MKLSTLPRVKLGVFPTPLQELSNLTKSLNGPRIFVKRDDMTGLAFGGNKTRKLEYLMGDALNNNADYIVTGGGFQSNWCTQAAAAAVKLGMGVKLIKTAPHEGYIPEKFEGNDLLHRLMGAEIIATRPENAQAAHEKTMEELRADGHRPYQLMAAGSTPPGVASYVNCVLELMNQSVAEGVDFDYLIHTTGSAGTQAGLVIGAKAFSTRMKVIAATAGMRSKDIQSQNVTRLIEESVGFLDLDCGINEDDIVIYDQYCGDGYGYMTADKAEAIKLLADKEGLFLDPVYTGSSMACLIDLCRKNFFKPDEKVVFLHTGGPAALFAFKDPLRSYMEGKDFPWIIPPWSPDNK
jgi:L-cysteate sulfo-lyase